jgi:predicted HTH transcriptional regulator
MPKPKEVFDCPENYWEFLTASSDSDFEGQYFDRKEAGRPDQCGNVGNSQIQKVTEQITECISAFANTNLLDGLLVIGISNKGEVKGMKHLGEKKLNNLLNINGVLSNQSAQVRLVDCQDETHSSNIIALIYVPYTKYGICQTIGNSPQAWKRQGFQNILLNYEQLYQLKRDKRILDFEHEFCCYYDPNDLDKGVLQEFRKVYLLDADYEYSDEQLLYNAGALIKDGNQYAFTNAGFLFFAANPQRLLTWSYIRLLRFETTTENIATRRLPTFEKQFSGSITKQIRNLRTFFKESGFFKLYQRRSPDGGFIEEPEYPYIAIDEAIVNAVAHREYASKLPIECESYKDGFIVRNSGCILQRDFNVPERFSLENIILVSTPRNSLLIEWLKMIRDKDGAAFVRALSEGTKRMRDEMLNLHLPAPVYEVSQSQTTVILFSNAEEREAKLQSANIQTSTEFANLFPLNFTNINGQEINKKSLNNRIKDILSSLKDALEANDWYIDKLSFGILKAHKKGIAIPLSQAANKIVRFYPAYTFQIRHYLGQYYLCIDYTLEVKNVQSLSTLLSNFQVSDMLEKTVTAQWQGWRRGKIITADAEWSRIFFFDFEREEQVPSNKVIPNLPRAFIEQELNRHAIKLNFHQLIKEYSLALKPNAAKIRAEKTQIIATDIAQTIFPLNFNDLYIEMQSSPVFLLRQNHIITGLRVESLTEPNVEFNRRRESPDIREGITKFGAYYNESTSIEIVPICIANLRNNMADLIERIKTGKYKYRGSERTFCTRFTYNSIINVISPKEITNECRRLLSEHPEWIGNKNLRRIFLIHVPEKGFSIDDETSPYYQIKRLLLENGIPCQMVDTPTLENPDWKDLNLALNLVAKCGITPWVLPDAIPDADFFIGLSYTQSGRRGSERLMGYANIFNQYGRWEFYSGNTEAFPYSEKTEHFQTLITQTLSRLSLSETPHIYFHYSAKFSQEDKVAILRAARSIRPQGTYSFVWINTHHHLRLYDSRVETDGSLSRGSYVITSPNQIYLSTTGYNPYRKTLGTPVTLEINIWTEQPSGVPNSAPDLKALAVQILSLTKLNWASTDSLCAEPITTKYAGDIAYLTDAFLRQNQSFHLHTALENTPWFI